jgi:hypothetical protein
MTSLLVIFALAWILVLVGTILIFEFIVPQNFCPGICNGVAKGAAATVMGVLWLLALLAMRNILIRRTLLVVA